MFCMKCGTQLADDAAFCFNCGNKIEANEPAAVNSQSFSAETAQTEEQGAYYHQPAFHQQMNGTVQPVYQQPVFKNQIPVKKGSKAMIPAMIFVVLSVFASIMVSISSFMGGEVGVGFENIAFAVCSILIAVYATSKSTVTSVLKGVGLVAVTALHAIFYGVAGFMTAIGIFAYTFLYIYDCQYYKMLHELKEGIIGNALIWLLIGTSYNSSICCRLCIRH